MPGIGPLMPPPVLSPAPPLVPKLPWPPRPRPPADGSGELSPDMWKLPKLPEPGNPLFDWLPEKWRKRIPKPPSEPPDWQPDPPKDQPDNSKPHIYKGPSIPF